MLYNETALAIVQAILTLSRSLKLDVVAEGVETQQQLAMLREMRCDQVQGYLVGRPMSPERVIEMIADQQPAA